MHGSLKQTSPLPPYGKAGGAREARKAARKPVLHLVMPGLEIARQQPKPREKVAAFLRRTGWARHDQIYGWQFKKGLPTILEINGEAVLRKEWRRRRIAANDNVRFMSYPMGGGGKGAKQVIGLVALLAVAALATVVTGGGAAVLFGSAFAAGTFGAAALGAAIGIGGSLLINALTAPKPGATNDPNANQDQIYSVSAQGNSARLGQPLPVWYGRLKAYPEFAATPWGEFIGNDQWLNVLLSVTMGSLEYEKLYLDDTIFWDPVGGISGTFPGAEVAFYEPGQEVTLFPTNVDQSSEVSGQQLPDGYGDEGGEYDAGFGPPTYGAVLGPFVSNPSGTQTQAIAIDFVFPAGCYTVNQDNNNHGYSDCTLKAEYAPCDDLGVATGGYTILFELLRRHNSDTPVRGTVKTDVAPGRYLVRLSRKGINSQSKYGIDTVIWSGLRSFLKGSNSFPDVSTVAIRLKASQSTQGSYKFGVLGTRKLQVWDGSSFVMQATRNNAWAFYDAVTNSQYGSTLLPSKTDFNAVVNHATGCDAREDTFDYRFESAVAVPDALDKILTPSRAKHFWLGDTVSIVRDEWRDIPTMMLTDREIVRDSTQIDYSMLGEEDPDAVVVEYVDETTWRAAQVQYPQNDGGFVASNAETKRIDGIVNRDQAFRECAFYYLQSIYRRENVEVGVEYEGRVITRGQVVRIQSELPQNYGDGGAVIAVAGRTLTLNPAPSWVSGPFYIRLRKPNGVFFGPVLCTEGVDPSKAVLNATSLTAAETAQSTTLAAVLAREDGAEYPSFELGSGVSESKLCVVLGGVPNGELFTLTMVVDDQRVHATDLGSPPLIPSPQFPSDLKVPLVVGLNASYSQGIAEPKLSASWFPAPGAQYYVADVSYDDGATWAQIYEGTDNSLSQVVTLAALRLRVQAVTPGKLRGPYTNVDVSAPTITIANNTVAIESLIEGIKYQITTLQDSLQDQVNQALNRIASVSSDIAARAPLDKKEIRSQLSARSDDALAQIDDVRTVAVTTEAAFASFSSVATAQFGSTTAFVSQTATAIATYDNWGAAQYAVTLNVNGFATGFNLLNGGPGFSTFTVVADKFQIQLPAYNAGTPTPVFTVGTVNGVPAVGINGASMYLDGTLNARAIVAGSITAAKIGTGEITSSSGVIGALSVQSLSIADNAATVPVVQNLASLVNISTGTTFLSFNMSVDTAGLAGKPISVYAMTTFKFTVSSGLGGTEPTTWQLFVNGTQVDGYTITMAGGQTLIGSMAGAVTLTATGGVMSIPVSAKGFAGGGVGAGGDNVAAGACLYAQAVKR